jgi:hypothetical protein
MEHGMNVAYAAGLRRQQVSGSAHPLRSATASLGSGSGVVQKPGAFIRCTPSCDRCVPRGW